MRRVTRPGLVTAVGVASVVVALGGAAGAVVTAIAAFLFFAGAQAAGGSAQAAKLAAAAAPPQPAARAPARLPPEEGAGGVARPQRRAVVEAFYAVRPIRPPRMEQLDAILARHGKTILLTPDEREAAAQAAPERVARLVTDHGQLFGTNPSAAPDFFRLTTGRLELYDDRAVFYPADGSPTLRNAYGRTPARRALSEAEVAAVVGRAKSFGANILNEAQAATLATVLSGADQKLVPTAGAAGAGAVQSEPRSVTAGAGGAVTVRFGDGQLDLGPQGQILAAPAGPAPPPKPSTAAFLAVMASSLAGLALSVVLFVAAVLLLRGLPSGRRLHFTWAWLKLVVTVAGAVAFWWMADRFYDGLLHYNAAPPGINPARFAAGPRTVMAQPWHPLAAALAGLVYPLVVLVALRARSVREYFHPSE